MKEQKDQDNGLISNIKEYANIRKELAMLTIAEKTSTAAAGAAAGSILAILGLFVFFFGSLTLGFYLSEVIGNTYSGFLIITVFYLIVALIVYFTQENMIKKPIENGVIKKIFKDRNEGTYEKQD
jgi:tetrahydromethanopterin S-methyltransferase subunit C